MIRAASVLRRSIATRGFHKSSAVCAASVFKMPAMSPTMTEGGVVAWKYKSGEEFSAGDVLLEVETDKATIDVEASDDGVMWEILVKDGATKVQVGEPIALLAEQGDDLATLERPSLDAQAAPKEEPKKEAQPEQPLKEEPKKSAPAPKSSGSGDVFGPANPKQKLSPAVELLLHGNHISSEDALAKIPASGPKGRLLKGDVLAYLGSISKDSVSLLAEFIKSREHLDLSNIKLATPEETHKLAQREEAPAAKEEAPAPPKPSNILNARLTTTLEEPVTRDIFQYAFEDSIAAATRYTYAQKYPQYAASPVASSLSGGDLFDDLISPPVTKSRFEVYDVTYQFSSPANGAQARIADDFDELLGLTGSTGVSGSGNQVSVDFKIKFDKSVLDAKQFVAFFEKTLAEEFSGVLTVSEP
ncbi:uncharacterized protein CANTADRAFT_6704 [Suhomyces tanzawaensis NRRL Y-17324]|uniref:Dihydrolipoamide dehydrogenase-binding protein of pyruvate dehydrogenase complex n=1 Tax=Suhomyces tanzawaensis NRRL Y-17324 TaxID=984487 RepID=A0A1E4SFL4_9ASCO|nr:uncharacterized protein CANTADRAFT_6704 [Suhomyces tanzawaensis NRRL Y-17324]ODV78304.1 hypothetical protein CANTADRAFT_6704 [Suhomyces tanzawaensis NRRL Y-17324]